MGCLYRGFQFLVLCGIGSAFLLAAFGLAVIGSERQSLGRVARATPIRSLSDIHRHDGPAWVKGRLTPANASQVLLLGQESCLILQKVRFRRIEREVRRGGTWTKRPDMQQMPGDRQEVPARLEDGAAFVEFRNWLGIEIGADLFGKHGDMAVLREWTEHGRWLATGTEEITAVSYLPVGIECWALGNFTAGKPQVLEDGAFYLTSLGPEGFALEQEKVPGLGGYLMWILLGLGLLTNVFGVRALIRGIQERAAENAAPPAAYNE